MSRIERTAQSLEDVLAIWTYIAIDQLSPDAADRLLTRVDVVLRLLASQPEMGVPQDRYRAGVRSFSVGNYVLFYRAIENGIRLIRVLHGARRFENLL